MMEHSLLSHHDRKNRIYIFSLDPVLTKDVSERISDDPRMQDCELIVPRNEQSPAESVQELERMAAGTITSKLLILDVRSQTLPRLQHAYNKVVGYNRKDFNDLCYTLLIGDGPLDLFHPGKSVEVFVPHLARFRQDFEPARFFYDPFLHYTSEERENLGIDHGSPLPVLMPKRLAKGFKQKAFVAEVRRYFRAASVPEKKRQKAKERRQKKLAEFFRFRIAKAFPEDKHHLQAWLSKGGYGVEGEILRLHLYPLFFEDSVFELMNKAQ